MKKVSIFVGSSEAMREVETGSARLIFESPPYEKMHPCCETPECLACYAGEDFAKRFARFLGERHRILASDGSYVLNFQPQVLSGETSPTAFLLPQAVVESGFVLIQVHIWAKPNASPMAPDKRLKNSFEYFWHFTKGQDYVFNKDAVREPSLWAGRDHRTEKYHPLGKDPGNVLLSPDADSDLFLLAKSQDQTLLNHPGKMKDGIAARFIKLLSNPDDLIVDGFTGTGQTGVEALALSRRFVGYELHDERAGQARDRLGMKENDTMTKPWLSAEEAAEYLSLAKATIYSKTSRKELPFHRQGRIVRYHREELDAWLRGTPVATGAAK